MNIISYEVRSAERLLTGASNISAFVTPDAFLQYTRMAFGLRNASATFRKLMSMVLGKVPYYNVYLDNVVIYSSTWAEHMSDL